MDSVPIDSRKYHYLLKEAFVTTTNVLRRAAHWHRPLLMFAGLMVVTGVVSVGGLLFDDRILVGSPIWLKPFKFSVSLSLYAVTWAWMLSLQRRPRRWVHRTATATAVLGSVEMVVIVGQVIRGKISHFNAATPFDATLFAVMGASIVAFWVLNLLQAIVLMRERLAEKPTAWAIKLGTVVSLAGMAVAFLMPQPTQDQLAAMRNGAPVSAIGAHSVGVPDGGPGMPITGWSLTGGDLRIPHFVGIHALQALPLLAMGLLAAASRWPRLRDEAVRVRLVLIGAGAYAGLLALTAWQALRGQPLLSPDSWTLGALGLIVIGAAAGVGIALSRQPRATEREVELAV
jgi:hypothetical protein